MIKKEKQRKIKGLNPKYLPGVLVCNHGPFSWGKDAHEAVYYAVVMEEVAKMASNSIVIGSGKLKPVPGYLLNRHFMRKHGANAYYGQK